MARSLAQRGGLRSSSQATSSPVDGFEQSNLRAILVGLIALKIAGIVLVFDPLGLQAFDLPKTLFSHFSTWLLIGVLAASLLRYGPGIVPRTNLHLTVGGLVVAAAASAATAENGYVALFGEQDSYLGLSFVADMAVLYTATAVAVRGPRDIALLASALAGASLVAAAYAAVQYAGLDPVVWRLDPSTRPFSTIGNPDQFGQLLSLCFGASLGVIVCPRQRLVTVVAAMFCALFAILAAVVATRGTLIGFAAALTVAAILRIRLQGTPARAVALGAVATLVAVWLLAPIVAATPLGQRALSEDDRSGRARIYASAVRAFESRPLLGYGPDAFGVAYPQFRDPALREGYADREISAHSWPLQTAVTTGVIGLAAQLVALAMFVHACWTRGFKRAPVVVVPLLVASTGYWAHGLVSVGSIAVDWLPWVGFGAVAAITGRRTPVYPPARARLAGHVLAAIVLGAAATAAITGVHAFGANRDAQLARRAWSAGDMSAARQAAESATRRDPGRAEYWNWLGLAREGQGELVGAESAYFEAASRAPYESNYWVNLALTRARLSLSSGTPSLSAAAVAAAEHAVEADPQDWRANGVLAEVAQVFGLSDVALRAAVRTIMLNAGHPAEQMGLRGETRQEEIAASAALKLTDQSEARRLLGEAVAARDSVTLRIALAQLALRAGDQIDARAQVERALQLDPQNAEARRILGVIGQ